MERTAIGHGKLILFGEHAVVFGSSAAGISLPCHTRITYSPPIGVAERKPAFSAAYNWLVSIRDNMKSDLWKVESKVPQCGGLGSSSALCVAAAKLVLGQDSEEYNNETHRMANDLEKIFHGTPSGLDTGLSSCRGLSAWMPQHGNSLPIRKPLTLTHPLYIVYGVLPRTGDTRSMVLQIRQKHDTDDLRTLDNIRGLSVISDNFIRRAMSPQPEPNRLLSETVKLIKKTQKILSDLNLSTEIMDSVLNLGIEEGALAGKLSGAGGGGAFFLLAPDEYIQTRLIDKLSERLDTEGILLALGLHCLVIH